MGRDTAAQAESIDWFARYRHGLPQDRARFLFHRAAMAGSPQEQLVFGAFVEIADSDAPLFARVPNNLHTLHLLLQSPDLLGEGTQEEFQPWQALPAERRDRFRFHHISIDEVLGSLVASKGCIGDCYCVGGHGERSNVQAGADRQEHDRRYANNSAKIQYELGWQPRHQF